MDGLDPAQHCHKGVKIFAEVEESSGAPSPFLGNCFLRGHFSMFSYRNIPELWSKGPPGS